jgi:hypothetical protein
VIRLGAAPRMWERYHAPLQAHDGAWSEGANAMEWYRQVQFISAVPMPPEMADEYGTTVNGMWASPEDRSSEDLASLHADGRRALFSVPMIALTPRTYERPENAFLLDEVCNDIDGRPAECDWYYWESKPVYAACIYSDAFRGYLLARCKEGVDRGYDVVNLDEIMTSIGLMDLEAGGTGFCARCLAVFRAHLSRNGEDASLASADDHMLREAIRADDALYERYRRTHEREAFDAMVAFIEEVRAHANSVNAGFAISANVGYLGNFVGRFGSLWGCIWGPRIDFVMMENDYRATGGPHLALPRGKFIAWYKLGAAFKDAPNWICPSINVPRQFKGEDRRRYYELMFLEAYANSGRWGYFWGPGVDAEARRAASAPDALKDHIRFIAEHRGFYEGIATGNEVAILYLEGPVLRRPDTHEKYLALAQALAESGFQFDVLHGGDGSFNSDELDPRSMSAYRSILVPEARGLGPRPVAALEEYARAGGRLVVFSESSLDPASVRTEDGRVLSEFWRTYRDADRDRIVASAALPASSRIETSETGVGVVRYNDDGRQIVHLLDYRYDEATDSVDPATELRLRIPWNGGAATCTLHDLRGEHRLDSAPEDGALVVDVPELNPYGVLVVELAAR